MHVSPQIGRAIGTTPRSMIVSSLVICQSCRNPQPVDGVDRGEIDLGCDHITRLKIIYVAILPKVELVRQSPNHHSARLPPDKSEGVGTIE